MKADLNPVMQRLRALDRCLTKADALIAEPFPDAEDTAYFKQKLVKYLRVKLALMEPEAS